MLLHRDDESMVFERHTSAALSGPFLLDGEGRAWLM